MVQTRCSEWTAPSNLPPAETTFRAQFYQATNPVVRVTESLPLTGIIPAGLSLVSDNTLKLSWSGASPGLSVSSSTNVVGPWNAVTNVVSFTNGMFAVTYPYTRERARFFRLK